MVRVDAVTAHPQLCPGSALTIGSSSTSIHSRLSRSGVAGPTLGAREAPDVARDPGSARNRTRHGAPAVAGAIRTSSWIRTAIQQSWTTSLVVPARPGESELDLHSHITSRIVCEVVGTVFNRLISIGREARSCTSSAVASVRWVIEFQQAAQNEVGADGGALRLLVKRTPHFAIHLDRVGESRGEVVGPGCR